MLASRGSVAPGHGSGAPVNGLVLGSLHLKAPRPRQTHNSGSSDILGLGLGALREER